MFSKFLITLIAMLAVLGVLYKQEIKENFANGTFPTIDTSFQQACPPSETLLGPWGGDGLQMTRVGNTVIGRGNCAFTGPNWPSYELGYDLRVHQQDLPKGVDTLRNLQAKNPTRFMNTNSPKFASKDATFRDMAAVPLDRTEISAAGACKENTVYSGFGQLQHSNGLPNPPTCGGASADGDDTVENYPDYKKAEVDMPADMCTVNNMGVDTQPVVYDRLIYSNIKSRLRGQGDYIRGDLLITPDNFKCDGGGHPGWFQVSVKPNRDLNMGAMAMIQPIGGRDEEIALGVVQGDCSISSFGI